MSGFYPGSEARALVDEIVRPLDNVFSGSAVSRNMACDPEQLATIAFLGWLGVALPEAAGGAGLSAIEETLMFEQLGTRLVSPNLMGCVLAAQLAAAHGNMGLAARLAEGKTPVCVSMVPHTWPGRLLVVDMSPGAYLLVLSPDGASLHDAMSVTVTNAAAGQPWGAHLGWVERVSTRLVLAPAMAVARSCKLLCAAQLSGIATATRQRSVEYAMVRQQFGHVIGANQAIKHRCADMAMAALACSELVAVASAAVAEQRRDADIQVSAASIVAARAALSNATANIQIHGGMGFSEECDAHWFLKRTHLLSAISCAAGSAEQSLIEQPSAFAA